MCLCCVNPVWVVLGLCLRCESVCVCTSLPCVCASCRSARKVVCFPDKCVPALSAVRGRRLLCAAALRCASSGWPCRGAGPRVCARRAVAAEDARPRRAGAGARRGGGRGRAALRGPAAAGSNGEAGAAPANYISGTSIIRGKTRKRWRPAPGGPLPERPGPSLLLLPPSSPRRPRPAPPPPRPRPRPHGRTLGRAAAGRAQPPPPPMRLVARLQVGPADTQPRGKFSAAGCPSWLGDSPPHSSLPVRIGLFGISLNFGGSNASGGRGGWSLRESRAWGMYGGERGPRGGGSPARVPEPLGGVGDRSLFPCPKSLLFLFEGWGAAGGRGGGDRRGRLGFCSRPKSACGRSGMGEAWRRSD